MGNDGSEEGEGTGEEELEDDGCLFKHTFGPTSFNGWFSWK